MAASTNSQTIITKFLKKQNYKNKKQQVEVRSSHPHNINKSNRQTHFDNKMNRLHIQSADVFTHPWFTSLNVSFIRNDKEEAILYVTKFVEDSSILFYHLARSLNTTDRIVAITNFIKLRVDGPILNLKYIDLLNDRISTLFSSYELQSTDEVLKSLRSGFDKYDELKNSPIYKKIYKFFMYALSLSFFDKIGISFDTLRYHKLEQEAIKRQHNVGVDFVHCILDTLLFLCERGYQCMKTGSLDAIYHSGSSYEKWFEKATSLKRSSLFLSNPEPHGIDIFSYLADLNEAIEKGQAIYKHALRLGEFEKNTIRALLADLELIKANQTTKRAAQKDRRPPFALELFGGSSVGKSTFVELVFYHYGKLFNLPTGAEFKYTRNSTDPFWSGYNSTQWCVVLDDIAFMNPNIAKNGDPSVMEMLQINNKIAFVPNQADLADKGRTPMNCRLLVGTTNTMNLNAHAYFSCPLAVQRRMPFVIEIEPKPEYTKDGCMLDSSKTPEPVEGCYPDFWIITVKRVRAAHAGAKVASYDDVFKFTDINIFLNWFTISAKAFETNNDIVDKSSSIMASIQLCTVCSNTLLNCSCNIPMMCQTDDDASIDTIKQQIEDAICQQDTIDIDILRAASRCGLRVPIHPDNVTRASYTNEQNQAFSSLQMMMFMGMELNASTTILIHRNNICAPVWSNIEDILSRSAELRRKFLSQGCSLSDLPSSLLTYEDKQNIQNVKRTVDHIRVECTPGPIAQTILDYTYPESFYEKFKIWCFVLHMKYYMQRGWYRILVNNCYPDWYTTKYAIKTCSRASVMRSTFRFMGDKVQSKIGMCTLLTSIIAVLSVGFGLFKVSSLIASFYTKDKDIQTHENVQNTYVDVPMDISLPDILPRKRLSEEFGSSPKPLTAERENVWVKEDYVLSTFDLGASTCSSNMSLDDFSQFIKNNFVHIRCEVRSCVTRPVRALCLLGNIYVTNNHGIPEGLDDILIHVVTQKLGEGISSNISFRLSRTKITRYSEQDLCFLVLDQIPPRKNIMKYLPSATLSGIHDGSYFGITETGEHFVRKVQRIRRLDNIRVDQLNTSLQVWEGKVTQPTVNGDCGSTLISCSNMGPIIMGLHVIGDNGSTVGAVRLEKEFITSCIESLNIISFSSAEPMLNSPTTNHVIGPLSEKSTLRFIQSGTMDAYGSMLGFKPRMKSRVTKTYIANALCNRGYSIKHRAPNMSSWKPWRLAMLDLVNPVSEFDTSCLDQCVENFTSDILRDLPDDELLAIQPYDTFTAINGAAGVSFVDKMNRSTSAGHPWGKSKKYYSEPIPPQNGLNDPITFDAEILDRVDTIIERYLNGERAMPIFTNHLKDEAVTHAKYLLDKVRVFSGAPLDWSIVVRKFTLGFIRAVQRNHFVFESAPGIVAQSLEWESLREYLTTFGTKKMFAGDFKAFDKRMPSVVIKAAYSIIRNVCAASGNFSVDELNIITGIGCDTAFPLMNFNGDVVMARGSNPSGHPLTVIVNGLANCLYMRYCYSKILNKPCTDFKQQVKLMTYGDDNVGNVSNEICQLFNHTSISNCLADVGITYTMADKEAKSVPFIDISQVSFLKRTWIYDPDVDAYLAPLEEASIDKMLTVCVKSKTICEKEQACAVLSTAVREYFYYGVEKFTQKRNLFMEIARECDLDLYVQDSTFPTWESLKKSFWDCSTHITLNRTIKGD